MSRRGVQTFLCILAALTPFSTAIAVNRTTTCWKLKSIYGNKVLLPYSEEYAEVAPENWSLSAQLSPSCIFEPSDAQDVAGALAVLVRDKTEFAVRGGGHMPTPGAANIDHGVLISFNAMQTMELAKDKSVARLGPGLRWVQVYDWIKNFGLGVVGGRFAPVGVPGLLLGGGISYFGSRYGWAANMVSNFEVVLANSTIVNANAHENSDLFWALKGGSSNFGIVTRFDIKTFPLREVYAGQSTFPPEYLNEFLDAASSYSVMGGGSDDIDGSYGPTVQMNMATGEINLLAVCLHIGSDPNPAAFANFTRIPTLSTNNQIWPSLADALAPTTVNGDRTKRQLFMATATQVAPDSVRVANETFFEMIKQMPKLKKVQGLTLRLSPQHISKSFLEAAKASGGDPMDVDPGNGLYMNLVGSEWDNEKDDKIVHKFSERFISALERKSKAKGFDYPFVYLNDADPGQEPFQLYGKGRSLKKLKAIREKYDPNRYFQRFLPGGFKLN